MAETELLKVKAELEVRENAAMETLSEKPGMQHIEEHVMWSVLSQLSMPVNAEIALEGFKVRDLLALEAGRVIESGWQETEDVSVKACGVQIGWSEFEVEDQRLLVRLTRLA